MRVSKEQREILERPAAAHEQFVKDNAAIDKAFADGTLGTYIEEKLANERIAAGFEGGNAEG